MGPNWELISDAMNSTLKIKVSACFLKNIGILSLVHFEQSGRAIFFSILVNCCVGYCCPGYYFLVLVNNWYLLLAD